MCAFVCVYVCPMQENQGEVSYCIVKCQCYSVGLGMRAIGEFSFSGVILSIEIDNGNHQLYVIPYYSRKNENIFVNTWI